VLSARTTGDDPSVAPVAGPVDEDVATDGGTDADAEAVGATAVAAPTTTGGEGRVATAELRAVVVDEDSPLRGVTVGALDVTVTALRRSDRSVVAMPPGDTRIEVGSTLYVVARPEAIRALGGDDAELARETPAVHGSGASASAEDD
jgi:hypothetical protein